MLLQSSPTQFVMCFSFNKGVLSSHSQIISSSFSLFFQLWKHLLKEEVVEQVLPDIVPLTVPALSDSDSSLETATPEIRANRAIRSNGSNIKLQINGVSIEIDASVSEEFLIKLIRAVCHA